MKQEKVEQPGNNYQEQLESALAAAGVTGASFAYWDGTALHTAVAGLRNSVTGDPVTTDTVMHIGSITKVFNTVLLMQLVDEGKIALDDPVVKHLPELRLRDREALGRITCAMLANHTSGINCDWLPEYGPDQERIVDSIARCADLEQLHPPGGGPSYCNMATVIAGYLTQKLRGTSWYALMKTRIYEPLGMRHALVDVTDLPRFRCSVGDLTDPVTGKLVQTTRPFLSPSFAPAGSTQMMSAADLITFARTLLNGGVGPNGTRILSAASTARMTEPTATMVYPVGKWGLGWMLSPGGLLHHGGGGPGVASVLYAHLANGRALALLTNCDRYDALKPAILDPILESWTGIRSPILQRQSGPVDPKPYEGVYESNLNRAEVFSRDGRLALRKSVKMDLYDNVQPSTEQPAATLYPLGDHIFEAEAVTPGLSNTQLKFAQPDSGGRMQQIAYGYRLLMRVK